MDRKVNIQVFNDQDLVDMFAKHKLLKCCSLTISYHHPSTDPPEIPDWECGSSVQSIEPPLTTTQPSHNIHNEPGEEESCPGSFFVIDHHTVGNKIRFNRLFFALKPCVDGFVRGCRPYLVVDSTFLNDRYRGQLCVDCAVDGHNWMYPVAVGVIDSETTENWVWFMERLKEAIPISPELLTFCTDCGQAVINGISEVFPEAEHKECMYHLVQNFKKRYSGKVFDDHLWAASCSWGLYMFNKHYKAMADAKPEAMKYLLDTHKKLWTRSQYRTTSKVDYVTNNLAESFNN
jgi:hypothetical protein